MELMERMRGGVLVRLDLENGYYCDDGERLDNRTVSSLIVHGMVKPVGDGLFGHSQSYILSQRCP